MELMNFKDPVQALDPDGRLDEAVAATIPYAELLRMYRLMVFTRLWNSKALSLQRQGRLGTLGSVKGHEASNIGMGLALGAGDWFCPSFREYGTMFVRGVLPKDLFLFWGGDERGGRPPEGSRVLPVCITVGSHLCHATGIAWAAKIRGEKIAVLCCSGDGSTSQGDFHESLNFAGVFKLPIVFAIQNNHWAISVPVEKQTASETLAEKASAYGIEGVRVDGNDVVAVYLTLKRLLDAARYDYKPSLVELVTYRVDDHTTADDASRYRTEEMVLPWIAKDPIERMRKHLTQRHGWAEKNEAEMNSELTAELEKAVQDYEGTPLPQPTDLFNHMYAAPPWNLREQAKDLRDYLGRGER